MTQLCSAPRALLSLFVLLLLVPLAGAQFGHPISSPAALNTNASTDSAGDSLPRLATDNAGNWVCVWSTKLGPYGTDDDILVARSSNDGASWSAPVPLNTNAATDGADYDRFPVLATNGSGTWITVWSSNSTLGGTIGTDSDILYARSFDNGATWSAPAALNSNAAPDAGSDTSPAIACSPSGTWIVAWNGADGFGLDSDLRFARSTNGGASWSTVAALNTNAATDGGDDSQVALACDAAGGWVAVWTSTENLGGTIGTDADILVARSADGGLSWSAPAALNSTAASDSVYLDSLPSLATDGAGTWMCAWGSVNPLGGTIGTEGDVLFAKSTNLGASWSAAAVLNSNATTDSGADSAPVLAADGYGNFVALWQSLDSLGGTIGTDYDCLVARTANAGAGWTAPAPFNTNSATDTGLDVYPAIGTDRAGQWVGVWYSSDSLGGTIGNDEDILFARFTIPAAPFTSFCLGDGSSGNCPCANNSAPGSGQGCRHSGGYGALLGATGSPQVSSPTLTLSVSALPGNVPHIYLQGSASLPTPVSFGDGLRCVGGQIRRLAVVIGAGSASSLGYPSVNLAILGVIPAGGGTFAYQVWFRDPSSAQCSPANSFNVSAGELVTWF